MKLIAIIAAAGALALPLTASALPCNWEPNFGPTVLNGDDSTTTVPLGINFPYQGNVYTSAFVSTNGFLSFGPTASSAGSGCCDGDVAGFLAGPPRIAVAWADQITTVMQNTLPGRTVFTWDGVEFSGSTPHRWQVQLFDDGRVIMAWELLPPDPGIAGGAHRHNGLIGVTPGNGAIDPGERNLSDDAPFSSTCVQTVYEFFARGPNGATGPDADPWDMEDNSLTFTPDGCGGWNVVDCSVAGVEICDDGIDNDADGDIDCADSDCNCPTPCDLTPIEAKLDDETRFTDDNELTTVTDALAALEAKLDLRLDEAVSTRASQASVDAVEAKLDALQLELDGIQGAFCEIIRLLHTPNGLRESDCGGTHYEWNDY